MALSTHDAFAAGGSGGRRRRRSRGRRGALSEINVTPLVDVMLVLLIIFMISAPLLTAAVPLELPKTEAGAAQDQPQPITVSIQANGNLFVGDNPVAFADLGARLDAISEGKTDKPIYVRADGKASYETVARVMASLSTSGYASINLITDTGGPSSQAGRGPGAASP